MIAIKVPPLGESIVEATVARWVKREGDVVAQGDTLVELETDKITVEVPAFKAGKLVRQTRREGDVVHLDDELGELDETASVASAATPKPAPSGPTPRRRRRASRPARPLRARRRRSSPRQARDGWPPRRGSIHRV